MSQPVAIVTGASSGIGAVIAQTLVDDDWIVYAGARRVDRMAPLAQAGIHVHALDVTDDASMVAFVDRVLAEQGRIDALVNNAGYGSYGALEQVPIEEARRQVEVNVMGLARMTQLVLPSMRTAGRGRIVNISSIAAKLYQPMGSWYHATKYAVEGLSDALRLELAPLGIQVVLVEPGIIDTEWAAIAREHLLAASSAGPYADQASRMDATLSNVERQASSPSVVGNAVHRALTARRPRIRYPVGRLAGITVLTRALLPDRAFDAVLAAGLRMAGSSAVGRALSGSGTTSDRT